MFLFIQGIVSLSEKHFSIEKCFSSQMALITVNKLTYGYNRNYFIPFKNSTQVSGKSVNTPVAPDLFNNVSYI